MKLNSRKLIISIVLFITSTIMLCMHVGSIDFEQWANFQIFIYATYVGGNIFGKFTDSKRLNIKSGE